MRDQSNSLKDIVFGFISDLGNALDPRYKFDENTPQQTDAQPARPEDPWRTCARYILEQRQLLTEICPEQSDLTERLERLTDENGPAPGYADVEPFAIALLSRAAMYQANRQLNDLLEKELFSGTGMLMSLNLLLEETDPVRFDRLRADLIKKYRYAIRRCSFINSARSVQPDPEIDPEALLAQLTEARECIGSSMGIHDENRYEPMLNLLTACMAQLKQADCGTDAWKNGIRSLWQSSEYANMPIRLKYRSLFGS